MQLSSKQYTILDESKISNLNGRDSNFYLLLSFESFHEVNALNSNRNAYLLSKIVAIDEAFNQSALRSLEN
jgi:hypothetical protein